MGGGGGDGEDEGDVVLMMGGRTTATEEKSRRRVGRLTMSAPYLSWSGGGRKGEGETPRRGGESW